MRDALFRLGFIACTSGYLLGLVLVSRWQGWPAGLGVAAGGVVTAILLAEDWRRAAPAEAGTGLRQRHMTPPYGSDVP